MSTNKFVARASLAHGQFVNGADQITKGLNRINYQSAKMAQGLAIANKTFGLGQVQATAYELKIKGVKDEIIKQTSAQQIQATQMARLKSEVDDFNKRQDQQAVVIRNANTSAKSLLQSLQTQIKTFGLSSEAAENYRLRLSGVDKATRDAIMQQRKQLAALEATRKANQDAAKAAADLAAKLQTQKLNEIARAQEAVARSADHVQRELEQEAQAWRQLTQTPLEKYMSQLRRLQQLNSAGLLSGQTFGRARNQIAEELKKAEEASNKFSQTANKNNDSLLTKFAKLGAAIYAVRMAFNAIKSAISTPLQLAASYESASIALETMVKSQGKSNTLLDQWERYAIASPFSSDEIIKSGKMLLAYSSDISNVTDELKMLGDVSAGSGAPLSELAYLYGTNRTQIKLYSKDIREMTARSVPLISMLAKEFGVAESKIFEMAENGQIHFGHLQSVLKKLTSEGGLYYQATDKQSKGLQGMWNALAEEATKSARYIGEAMVKGWDLKNALASLTEFTIAVREDYFPIVQAIIMQGKDIFDYWASWGTYIRQAAADTDSFIGRLSTVYDYIKSVAAYMPSNWVTSAITSSFADNLEKAQAEAKQVKKELETLGSGKAAATIPNMTDDVSKLNEQMKTLADNVKGYWESALTPLEKYHVELQKLNETFSESQGTDSAMSQQTYWRTREKMTRDLLGVEQSPREKFAQENWKLTEQNRLGYINEEQMRLKQNDLKKSIFGVTIDDDFDQAKEKITETQSSNSHESLSNRRSISCIMAIWMRASLVSGLRS